MKGERKTVVVQDCLIKAFNGTYQYEKKEVKGGGSIAFYWENGKKINIQDLPGFVLRALIQAINEDERRKREVTFQKTEEHQPMGEYQPTEIDREKDEADFRITQTGPYYIRWKDGRGETVTAVRLERLKEEFTWTTDF